MQIGIEVALLREFFAKYLKSGAHFRMTTLTKTLTYPQDAQLALNTKV